MTRARASATRCCWPPDSCAGTRSRVGRHGDELEELHRLLTARRLVDALHLEREGDVVDAGEMREQRVALKHHGRPALRRRQVGDIGRADENVAFGRALVASDHAQGRGLAAARRSEQTAIGSGRNPEIDGIDRGRRAITLREMNKFEVSRLQHHLTIDGRSWNTVCNARASRAALFSGSIRLPGGGFPPAPTWAEQWSAAKLGAQRTIAAPFRRVVAWRRDGAQQKRAAFRPPFPFVCVWRRGLRSPFRPCRRHRRRPSASQAHPSSACRRSSPLW